VSALSGVEQEITSAKVCTIDKGQIFYDVRLMSAAKPVEVRDPLKTDLIYGALRQRIRTLRLAPGSPLRKEDIAAEFSVSRAPVNDAIARLAEEGLVDVFPQHGSFVAKLRGEDVREGLFIRMALEIEVVRRVAAMRDATLVATLNRNIAQQEEALASNNLEELYRLDEAMHETIFGAVPFARAAKTLEAARAPLDRMRQIVLPNEGRPQATVREHRAIVDAITSGDSEFAGAAMRMHLNALLAVVEVQLETLES
jgi:GntR family transcriptional regulator, rspAB operon transcriptional repressor